MLVGPNGSGKSNFLDALRLTAQALDDVRNGELVGSTQLVMPPAVSDRLFLASAAGIEAFRPVFDGLSAVTVYNISPDSMRRPQKPETGDLLRRDGSNVASVFGRLRRERPAAKERIVQYLSRIDAHPWRFPGSSMSDGTLRALGVLVALFGGTTALASPVGIEEPGSALHPAAAGLLLDALRDASEARQVREGSQQSELSRDNADTWRCHCRSGGSRVSLSGFTMS